jgi:aryl-alcohol dehydrogenase (NADP+)
MSAEMTIRGFAGTDLDVFPLGLGTVQVGMAYGIGMVEPPPDDECVRVLHHALDNGINYFDTAPAYERSEYIVGKALEGVSEKPIVATKFVLPDPGEEPEKFPQIHRIIEESAANSLRTLHLDCIDLLQFHNAVSAQVTPELFECMDGMTKRGMIRYWGATVYAEADAVKIAEASDRFRTLQAPYSILDQRLADRMFPLCRDKGMGLVFRSAFLKGILSHRYTSLPPELSGIQGLAKKADAIAQSAGMTLPELALRFAAFSPFEQVTLFGGSSVKETEANLETLRRGPLPDDVFDALTELSAGDDLLDPVYSTLGWELPS